MKNGFGGGVFVVVMQGLCIPGMQTCVVRLYRKQQTATGWNVATFLTYSLHFFFSFREAADVETNRKILASGGRLGSCPRNSANEWTPTEAMQGLRRVGSGLAVGDPSNVGPSLPRALDT